MHLVLDTDIRGPWPQGTEVIYFGMGCFWGAEKKLWNLPGVVSTAVGYMGGSASDPTYPLVCTGSTGHSEIVLVAYDPSKTSIYDLLKCFWENHDPTQGNRQGNDIGTQYRSAIFYTADDQLPAITAAVERAQRLQSSPVVTTVQTAEEFYLAEDYHQDYYALNGEAPYCKAVIAPKLRKVQVSFSHLMRPQ